MASEEEIKILQKYQPITSPNNTSQTTGNCKRFLEAIVVKSTGPTKAQANIEVTLNVDYRAINDCGGFGRFEITETDYSIKITLIAKYEVCFCTANASKLKTTYSFTPTKKRTYFLKFKKSINSLLHI